MTGEKRKENQLDMLIELYTNQLTLRGTKKKKHLNWYYQSPKDR